MTAASGVAVVATQLARTDRRALSEAWYSALHLAHTPAAHAGAARRSAIADGAALQSRPARRGDSPAVRSAAPALATRAAHRCADALLPIAGERRRPVCAAARRIERAVATLATHRQGHAVQTVDVAGGRVRLLVRTDCERTRIIAVCSAPLRETVERALASARFALAAAGGPAVVR